MSQFTSDAQSSPRAPRREQLFTRWGQLKSERATWWAHWQELTTYLLPRNGRYFVQDRDKGWRRHNNIYDNTGTRALRVLGAGLMAGATSPARQWFRLSSPDPELNKFHPVKLWLDDTTMRMQRIFQKSNTYRALHTIYEEMATFGTGVSIVLPDFNNVIHHYPLTCGEYCIATDYMGRVNTLYREYEKTVAEVVQEFGRENCSTSVQNLYDRGTLDAWITIIHAIEPRTNRNPSSKNSKDMPWASYHFEVGGDHQTFLRESGFQHFPALVPRWATAGGDIYGNSPGMEALGDIKQLQHEQLRKAQAIDYQVKPPLQVPTSMKNRDVETLPGGVSFVDSNSPTGGIRSAFEVNLNLSNLLADIQDCRDRIRGSFYADLFLMLSAIENTRMTATEVAERHEEKLLMLGPVLERMHNELLSPLVDLTFSRMVEANLLLPPPKELQGMDLSVEFVSMLAQAQRAIGTNGVDRFVANLGVVAGMRPEALDKFDSDAWVDTYSDMLGVDPKLVVGSDEVLTLRQARNQALAMKEQMAAMQQGAGMVKDLAQAKTADPSALTGMANMLPGTITP